MTSLLLSTLFELGQLGAMVAQVAAAAMLTGAVFVVVVGSKGRGA